MHEYKFNEAVKELKEEHFSDLFEEELAERRKIIVEDCQVDLELDIRLPEQYLPNIAERLKFYRRIAGAETEEDLREIQRELIDRFGPMPASVLNLFDATRIRELVLKAETLRLYLVSDRSSPFYTSALFTKYIEYVQTYPSRVRMKESPKYLSLIFEDVASMKRILSLLKEVHRFLLPEDDHDAATEIVSETMFND